MGAGLAAVASLIAGAAAVLPNGAARALDLVAFTAQKTARRHGDGQVA